jgi:hypothetical protein
LLLAAGRSDAAGQDFEGLLDLREDEAKRALNHASGGRWVRVADAILDGDAAGAADLLSEIGQRSAEAYARLRAGGPQARRALDFYRSVGAVRYIRQAEESFSTVQGQASVNG